MRFLQDFPRAEWEPALDSMAALFFPAQLGRNEHLVRTGEKSRKLAFIGKGVMRAYHSSPNGSEYTKTIFLENEFIAPLAALTTGDGSPISLQALTDAELLVADYFELERLYRKHHCLEHMGRVIIQWEWVKKEVREIRLVTLSAEERYDLFLSEFPGLEHRIPWYYIASLLGITPVALSRIRGRKRAQNETAQG